jgi:hypothetical protein
MSLQLDVRAFLVHTHETAIAGNIRSQNCCKPALHDKFSDVSGALFEGTETGMTKDYPQST